MSIEDTIGYRNRVPACAVCGKNVKRGGGFVRVKHGDQMVEPCCPLCLETFQKDPEPYLNELQRVDYFRYLAEWEKASGEEGFVPAFAVPLLAGTRQKIFNAKTQSCEGAKV